MELEELKIKLNLIREKGFVESLRSGSTGVGYTFENILGISENNNSAYDIENLALEIKAQRKDATSKNTAFTQSTIWLKPQRYIISKYGVEKISLKRIELYQDFSCKKNHMSLKFIFDDNDNYTLIDTVTGDKLCSIHIEVIKHRILQKLKNVLFVHAISKKINDKEYFHFNRFKIYKDLDCSTAKIKQLLNDGIITISFRCYINCDTNSIRDHGVAFRIPNSKFNFLYNAIEEI